MHHHRARGIVLFLIILVVFGAAPVSLAERPYDEAIARFRAWADARMKQDEAPGLSIGFLKDDVLWAEGFGYSDLENRVPARAESAYRLASVTKPITAIGVLKLVEQGKIDLDATVQTYVPFYPEKPWPITVRQVLGHLGGIPHYVNYDLEGHFKDHKNTKEAIAVFAEFDLVGEPGTSYRYSSYGYNLLGAVIEGASGKSYGEFMREALWGPLGMNDTRMDDPDAIIPNRVRGYRRAPSGGLINSEFVNISSRFAAGGTRSTVIDLLKLGRGLNDGKVLKPESIERMLTPMATSDGESTGYGMGWGVRPVNGRFSASHGGGQAETATYFLWLPDEKLAIAAAMNLEGGARMVYVRRLYEEVMGEAWSPPVYAGDREHRLVHAVMRRTWDWGMALAEHSGGPVTDDPDQLAAAFAEINETVNLQRMKTDYDGTRDRIRNMSNPAGGELPKVVGSWMAARLAEQTDAATIERLHSDAAIPFFHEYVRLYKSSGKKIPKAYRFSKPLEKLIARWNEDWSRTWTAETRQLDLGAADDLAATVARLIQLFEGASVYPDYWDDMEGRIEELAQFGRLPEALQIAEAGRTLYPQSGAPHFYTGLLKLATGDAESGVALIHQAAEHDPGMGSASFLNGWAYRLRSSGFLDLGLGLLQVAVRMHPDAANLYDSLGEFHLEKGNRDEAKRYYQKALEIDPDSDNARRMLADF